MTVTSAYFNVLRTQLPFLNFYYNLNICLVRYTKTMTFTFASLFLVDIGKNVRQAGHHNRLRHRKHL